MTPSRYLHYFIAGASQLERNTSLCLSLRRLLLPCSAYKYVHTSSTLKHMLDARDSDHEKKQKQLIVKETVFIDEVSQQIKNKKTFQKAVAKYNERHDKYKRGHVEFIYASLDKMVEFGVHKDIGTYKILLDIFPKGKMISTTMWQAEMMHYPKQQQCAIDLLDQMEHHGVCPDDAMGAQLIEIFGKKAICFRKYQRMMYWMPKFKNINPYPVPFHLPVDPIELAILALKRMAVDKQNQIKVFQSSVLESSVDDTFIASAQSPVQCELLSSLPRDKPIFVEGGFTVWLRDKSQYYFILRSEITPTLNKYQEVMNKEEEEDLFNWKTIFTDEKPCDVIVKPSVHEQEDGTILGMCITGTGSKDSLRSWITFLQETNPVLKDIPVIFTLRTPEDGLVVHDENENSQHVPAEI